MVARRAQLFQASGVDPRHARRKQDELQGFQPWVQALDRALSVIGRGEMLVLLGTRGNGKTQLAVECVRRCCRECRSARYLRLRELGMALREAYGPERTMSEKESVAQFVAPDLLVLDECQERPDRDFERRSLTLILDKRYGQEKPTILIANMQRKAFGELVGPSVLDRIKEGGQVIACDWLSFRGVSRASSTA